MIMLGNKMWGQILSKRQELGKIWSDYFAWKPARIYWLVALVLNLALWLMAWLIYRRLDQELVILHYNVIFGIDSLGAPAKIYWLPGIGLLIFSFNALASLFCQERDRFLIGSLLVGSSLINVILGLALYSLYLVNFVNLF